MTEQPAASPQRNRGALAFVALLLIAGVGFLYVKAGRGGKKEHSAACDASKPLAQSLASLAKGELAALAIAKEPEPIQALAFNGPGRRADEPGGIQGQDAACECLGDLVRSVPGRNARARSAAKSRGLG